MSLRVASSSLTLARSPSDKKKSALHKKGKTLPPPPAAPKSSQEENDSPDSGDEIFELDGGYNSGKSNSAALDFDDVVYRSDNSGVDSSVEPAFTMDDDVVYTRNRSDADGAPSNGKDDEVIDFDDVVIVKEDVANPTIPVAIISATSPVAVASTPPFLASSSPGSSMKRSADDYLLAKWKTTVTAQQSSAVSSTSLRLHLPLKRTNVSAELVQEVWLRICSHLGSATAIASISATCQTLRRLAAEDYVWSRAFRAVYPPPSSGLSLSGSSPRSHSFSSTTSTSSSSSSSTKNSNQQHHKPEHLSWKTAFELRHLYMKQKELVTKDDVIGVRKENYVLLVDGRIIDVVGTRTAKVGKGGLAMLLTGFEIWTDALVEGQIGSSAFPVTVSSSVLKVKSVSGAQLICVTEDGTEKRILKPAQVTDEMLKAIQSGSKKQLKIHMIWALGKERIMSVHY